MFVQMVTLPASLSATLFIKRLTVIGKRLTTFYHRQQQLQQQKTCIAIWKTVRHPMNLYLHSLALSVFLGVLRETSLWDGDSYAHSYCIFSATLPRSRRAIHNLHQWQPSPSYSLRAVAPAELLARQLRHCSANSRTSRLPSQRIICNNPIGFTASALMPLIRSPLLFPSPFTLSGKTTTYPLFCINFRKRFELGFASDRS